MIRVFGTIINRGLALAVLVALAACAAEAPGPMPSPAPSPAVSLTAVIDLSDQQVTVTSRHADGSTETRIWPVSTARQGYTTPLGNFRPLWLSRFHRSSLFDDAPMPFSVFFHRGVAIHGTTELQDLGRAVSHGCVRLHPAHAEILFNMVLETGKAGALITVQP